MSETSLPESKKNRLYLGLALGFVGVAAFSLTLPMTRLAVTSMGSETIAVWRGLLAAIAAGLILWFFYRRLPGHDDVLKLFITGLGVVVGFPLFMTYAMETIPASHGAIVVGLLPITTAVMSIFVNKEKPSLGFWGFSILATIAVLFFIFRISDGGLKIGHIYLFIAVLSAAIGYALGGQAARHLGAISAICWALVIMLPFLVVASFFVAPVPWSAPIEALLPFLYLAFISQLAGFFAWYAGLAIGGVARVSQVQQVQIFLTLIATAFMQSEPLSSEMWLFAAVVVGCVVMSARFRINVSDNA